MFAGLMLTSGITKAQGKVGHISMQELILLMPEYKAAQQKLDSLKNDIQFTLNNIRQEFESKSKEYEAKGSTWTEFARQSKEKELKDLQERYYNLSQDAESTIAQKEAEVLKPVVNKAKEKVAEVAKELGYTTVIDNSTSLLIVSNPTDDLLPAVMKKLGIPATELTKLRAEMKAAEAQPQGNPGQR